MDIHGLKQIPIADFLRRLGHTPASQRGHEWMYFAPYRKETRPSFRLNTEKNVFYDFGTGTGGDIFTLAGEMVGSSDFKAQAKFIADNLNVRLPMVEHPVFKSSTDEPKFEDVEVRELTNRYLLYYLKSRGISPDVARAHCDELHYWLHGKEYYAVGFRNVAGGYEIRNKFFKGSVPPKEVSLIAGNKTCNVFEGFIDFLSAVQLDLQKDCSALVLNSTANVHKAFRFLDGYDAIVCFLDNDDAGRHALRQLSEHYPGKVIDRSDMYKEHTVELRLKIKPEGNYTNTVYTIRYFQYDGEGMLKLVDGPVLVNNDRVLLESKTFRLNYTARSADAHKFLVVIEDNFGSTPWEQTFEFNKDKGDDDGAGTIVNPINPGIVTPVIR